MGEGTFRTIGQLAERCGAYCWVEHRLFQLTGSWAGSGGDPAIRASFSVMSAGRAQLAGQWRDRLPVRAGVDRGALVAPPPGPLAEALVALAADLPPSVRLAALVTVVLPRLLSTYEEHLAVASPVSEAPVMATLELAGHRTAEDISRGGALVQQGLEERGVGPFQDGPQLTEFCHALQRPFGDASGIFPAVWAS